MLHGAGPKQLKNELVCVERLVPKDHLLRKIAKFTGFCFIHDKVIYGVFQSQQRQDALV